MASIPRVRDRLGDPPDDAEGGWRKGRCKYCGAAVYSVGVIHTPDVCLDCVEYFSSVEGEKLRKADDALRKAQHDSE
jgi:hypothetical protein